MEHTHLEFHFCYAAGKKKEHFNGAGVSAAFFLNMIKMHTSFFQKSSEVSLRVESLFLCGSVEVMYLHMRKYCWGQGERTEARVFFCVCVCEYLFYWTLIAA